MIDLIDLPKGKKVSADGAYRLDMDRYHTDICDGPSISSSGLRAIECECPAEYWGFSPYNPARYEEPNKPAFSFGRAAHALLLGDEVFSERYAVRPEEWSDWRKKDAKEWRSTMEEAGRTVITPDDLRGIREISYKLAAHPLLADLLTQGEVEPSLIWKDPETGVWIKSRPDALPDTGMIGDFKTIGRKASVHDCNQAITNHHYYMQMGLIAEAMEALFGWEIKYAVLVFAQTSAPYHVTPIEISTEALEAGRMLNRKAIRTFAHCMESGEWPGYTDGIPVYYFPEWREKQIERALNTPGRWKEGPESEPLDEFVP